MLKTVLSLGLSLAMLTMVVDPAFARSHRHSDRSRNVVSVRGYVVASRSSYPKRYGRNEGHYNLRSDASIERFWTYYYPLTR